MQSSPTSVRLLRAALALVALGGGVASAAAQPCAPVVGELVSVEGRVDVQRADSAGRWERARIETPLCQRDTVRAGRDSRAAIALINEAVLRIDAGTTLQLLSVAGAPEERSFLDVLRGAIKSFSRKPRLISVNSPYLNGTIEGTEFELRVAEGRATLTVLEGRVSAANDAGQVTIGPGQAATGAPGSAPTVRTLVTPRDAVQWTLYYPPVLALGETGPAAALEALDRVEETARDARYFVQRASALLSVGRVARAQSALERALALDPGNASAFALRSILAVVQNRRDPALADAEHAIALGGASAAYVAHSYALQARFEIAGARDSVSTASRRFPDDALVWARLAELSLMLGEREAARAAAGRAVSIAPGLGRVHLVLGFVALAEFRLTEARASFERAIRVDSSDPMARLGVGLAAISAGMLAEGRREIEIAVSLDSGSALLRTYLGKAYFEEHRGPLDAEQLAIAKVLDPRDPTAYLYDAILKQTENRPVEALADLQASIERNDNRAVYRSRLLLDKDRAARGASLARIYGGLGFDRLGLNESTRSLSQDPANSAAHRFLSDTYRGQTRREVSRVSELLQAQMNQELNLNPIQPSVATTNLNIITSGGPGTPGFNEFTPLFERNQAQLNATGSLGDNGVWNGEAVASGVFGRFSGSVGGFAFEGDGFRPNNGLSHRIADGFVQAALSPALNVQGEVRYRKSKRGDLAFNFDPDSFSAAKRQDDEVTTGRFGLRFAPSDRSAFLLSLIFGTANRSGFEAGSTVSNTGLPADFEADLEREDESEQYEAQFIHSRERFNLVTGLAYSRVVADGQNSLAVDPGPVQVCINPFAPPPGNTMNVPVGSACVAPFFIVGPILDLAPLTPIVDSLDLASDDYRGYIYTNWQISGSATATVGLSYTDFENELVDFRRWNPKVGLQWDIVGGLRFRAAYFRVAKPVLASNRLLEPTQVAGFNQFFDDADATRSARLAAALDWRAFPRLYVGLEVTGRDIDHPFTDFSNRRGRFQDRDERFHRAYLNWVPTDRVAVSVDAIYDKWHNEEPNTTNPRLVRTQSLPVRVAYFHPNGLFGSVSGTYVDQEVVRRADSTLPQGETSFVVVDVGLGWRFPKRRGALNLSIRNLLDRDFKYQDDSFRNFGEESSGSRYIPERTILGSLTLSF